MKNVDRWKPSKFVFSRGKLIASRNAGEVGPGSRLFANRVAASYGRAIPQYARGRLVDLGCGKVPLFQVYREYVTSVTCLDWASSKHGSEFVDRHCDLNGLIPLSDACCDTVILSDVLEHIANPYYLLSEVARITAYGGHALLSVPFLYGLHEAPHDYFRYTEFALRKMANACGLQVVQLESTGGAPEVVTDIVCKLLARVPVIGGGAAAAAQTVAGYASSVWPGKYFSQKTRASFPLGYFGVLRRDRTGPRDDADPPLCVPESLSRGASVAHPGTATNVRMYES